MTNDYFRLVWILEVIVVVIYSFIQTSLFYLLFQCFYCCISLTFLTNIYRKQACLWNHHCLQVTNIYLKYFEEIALRMTVLICGWHLHILDSPRSIVALCEHHKIFYTIYVGERKIKQRPKNATSKQCEKKLFQKRIIVQFS